jgi:tRNA(fMet)-specific endonuclease VapC
MSLYVLDTDILSLFQEGHPGIQKHVAQHRPDDLATSIISVEEQLSGWYTLRRRVKGRDQLARAYERIAENVRMLSRLQILSFSARAIDRYEVLRRSKLGVKGNDLRIAAIALDISAIVVTRNLVDFRRIPGLTIEDWSV